MANLREMREKARPPKPKAKGKNIIQCRRECKEKYEVGSPEYLDCIEACMRGE